MSIAKTEWEVPQYSKNHINAAGNIVRKPNVTDEDKVDAITIIENWRAAHAYPLHVFYINLRNKAIKEPQKGIMVAERLKRMDSIVKKLQREGKMNLSRMQDIGGCRMVLPTIEDVYSYSEEFKTSRIRHELKKINDYISYPKNSGYRSLHLVYRFKTVSSSKEIYNQYQMLIELQFRTHLQHIWATSLEAIGLFNNQSLKSGQGNIKILRFFALISSLFAIREKCPIIPGTSNNQDELISEIREINEENHVLDMLRAVRYTVIYDDAIDVDRKGYYILALNYEKKELLIDSFKPSELEKANREYDDMENECFGKPFDIVMVRAESYKNLRRSYPNYFYDIKEFIEIVEEYLR